WLAEMVAAVPPSTWSEEMGRSPAELVTVALESDWKEALLVGWGFAALRHRDAAWAEALLRAWVLEPEGMLQARQVPAWMQLPSVLPAERADAFLSELIQGPSGELAAHPVLPLLL